MTSNIAPFGAGGRYKPSYRIRSKSREMAEAFREAYAAPITDDADWIVEQGAHYDVLDGRIAWMIVLCGGYQPLASVPIAAGTPETSARQIVV